MCIRDRVSTQSTWVVIQKEKALEGEISEKLKVYNERDCQFLLTNEFQINRLICFQILEYELEQLMKKFEIKKKQYQVQKKKSISKKELEQQQYNQIEQSRVQTIKNTISKTAIEKNMRFDFYSNIFGTFLFIRIRVILIHIFFYSKFVLTQREREYQESIPRKKFYGSKEQFYFPKMIILASEK
eukprot:TRINITY_DN10821_c0_g1_i2.p1 TRINITY_DN10821_c0_g1~~TRINITY_DN10821_c0_g1_i2.p1  ORF type:complete len:185 (-),score=40.40 TRINITY_DN10821_c0_g1_i2:157-711(-)